MLHQASVDGCMHHLDKQTTTRSVTLNHLMVVQGQGLPCDMVCTNAKLMVVKTILGKS